MPKVNFLNKEQLDQARKKQEAIQEKKLRKGEIQQKARELFLLRYSVSAIREKLGIKHEKNIYNWINKYNWKDELEDYQDSFLKATIRFNQLIDKPKKTNTDLEEMKILRDLILGYEGIKQKQTAIEEKTKTKTEKADKPEKKRKRNDVSHITQDMFDKFVEEELYTHQKIPYLAGKDPKTRRNRIILKPRQVGGTYGTAFEAFERAVMLGHNQIFLSATKAQAEVFKSYIAIIAEQHFDCEISGNPCRLSNGAMLYFISPNSNAQSRSGDVVFDEIFWVANWKKVEQLAAKMATQSKYTCTYISTPSTIGHQAYEYWNGDKFNLKRPENERVTIDIHDKDALKKGRLDGDTFWRFAYTVHDVVEWGFIDKETNESRIDIEQLKLETDPDIFPCLFECEFIDDTESVFKLTDVLACAVNIETWTDFDTRSDRPFGDKPVTVGYDPAGKGDNASNVVLSKPMSKAEKFRLLRKYNWRGLPVSLENGRSQCSEMKDVLTSFNVEDMFLDATGPGIFVGETVKEIFPNLVELHASVEEKARMVQKAKSVFRAKRFEYDENDKDLPLAFMTVVQKVTGGGQITYDSNRNSKGHGDEAWAIMHAMMCETFNIETKRGLTIKVHN